MRVCVCAVMCGIKKKKILPQKQLLACLLFFCFFSSKPNIDKPLPRHLALSTLSNPERGRDGVQSLPLTRRASAVVFQHVCNNILFIFSTKTLKEFWLSWKSGTVLLEKQKKKEPKQIQK